MLRELEVSAEGSYCLVVWKGFCLIERRNVLSSGGKGQVEQRGRWRGRASGRKGKGNELEVIASEAGEEVSCIFERLERHKKACVREWCDIALLNEVDLLKLARNCAGVSSLL